MLSLAPVTRGTKQPGVTIEDGRYIIRFRYNPQAVEDVRLITGRKWHPDQKHWTAPMSSGVQVKAFADRYRIPFLADAVEIGEPEPLTVSLSGSSILLRFGYDPNLTRRISEMAGATWSNISGGWLVDLEASVEVLALIESCSGRVDDSAHEVVEAARLALSRIEASKATDTDFQVPGLGVPLFDFQRAGIEYGIHTRRLILADEMGLGKTRQALGILHLTEAYPALIVVPSVAKINWRREATAALPGRTVDLLKGTRGGPRQWADVTICNYDILHAWVEHLPELKGLVADESHMAKNPRARRTKACYEASDKVVPNGVRIAVSGTPVLNSPMEIVPQMRIAGILREMGGAAKFRKRYGGGQNLGELNRRLRSVGYVRRRKEEVLKDLPPKLWAPFEVEGDPRVMAEYRKAEADIVTYLAEKAQAAAVASGASPGEQQSAAWKAAMRASAAEHLVAITHLKQLAAKAKMASANEWITDFLESGSKLITFAWHREIVDSVADTFANGAKIQGGMAESVKQGYIDSFQGDPEQKVIACQIKAAGVAITLHAASDVLFLEQGWTPADMDQAVDRAHRIGQRDSVTGWNMLCAETIDVDIAELIADKRRTVDAVTDGDVSRGEGKQSILGDLVVRLAERGLSAT